MADALAEQAKRALEQLEAFKEKWTPILSKQISKALASESELVSGPLKEAEAVKMEINEEQSSSSTPAGTVETEPVRMEVGEEASSSSDSTRTEGAEQDLEETPELSITAQYVISENLNKLKQVFQDMLTEHRHIHSSVSKCGKDLDRSFQTDLMKLIKNEKNIEANPEYLQKANRLIFDHLMSLGRIDVAETFMKESEMSLDIPSQYDVETMRSIMEPFKNRQFLPAIEWLKENAPEEDALIFRLHRQHIVQLLIDGKRLEALKHARELQPFAKHFSLEFTQIMTAIVSYPAHMERYKNLFHGDIWLNLEADLAAVISEFKSPLRRVLNTGAKAVPMLLTLRSIMNRRTDHYLLGDEMPIEVPVDRVHSSFTCPILKTQSTETNPPMRLNCGHVISREALTRLAQNLRNTRLKCPYCPEESMVAEAKRVFF